MPNGKIQPQHVSSLQQMGAWLQNYGVTIYDTQKGPLAPNDRFVTTQKGKTIYLHLMDANTKMLHIEEFPVSIKKITHFDSNSPLSFQKNKFGLTIDLTSLTLNDIDNIIKIELR